MKKAIFRVLITLIALTCLLSCTDKPPVETGRLSIALDSRMIHKTIQPEDSSLEIARYVIEGKRVKSDHSFSAENTTGDEIVVERLVAGEWNINAKGYDSNGNLIAESLNNKAYIKPGNTEVTIQLQYLAGGNGIFELSIEIPSDDTEASKVAITIYELGGTIPKNYSIENFTEQNGQKLFASTITLSVGKYDVDISVLDAEGTEIGPSYEESLHVYNGKKSSLTLPWAGGMFGRSAAPKFINLTHGNTYFENHKFEISAIENATIRYTLDGTEPTSTSAVYSGPIEINSNGVIKAIAIESGKLKSLPITANYYVKVAPLSFSFPADTYDNFIDLAITTTTEGADIYYTTDGSVPSKSNGTHYTGEISIDTPKTLKAIAYKDGLVQSDIKTVSYDFAKVNGTIGIEAPTNYKLSIEYPEGWNKVVSEDSKYVFNAVVTPKLENLTYTWYLNGNVVPSATSNSFVFSKSGNGSLALGSQMLSVKASSESISLTATQIIDVDSIN